MKVQLPRFRFGLRCLTTACLGLLAVAAIPAGEMKAELDFSNKKSFRGYWQRYGPTMSAMMKAIQEEETGFRLWIPGGTKESQMGLYSSGFTLAGDFEISVAYEWLTKESPTDGYGVSCGIAVEHRGFGKTVGSAGTIALARGELPDKQKGSGYIVTRGERKKSDKKDQKNDIPSPLEYRADHFATSATKGRLVLKREKDMMVCLVSDDTEPDLRELDRYKFTRDTVSPVRIFIDQGDQKAYPSNVDAYFSQIRVKAEEIDTTGFPKMERRGSLWWWIAGAGLALVAVIGVLALRRNPGQAEQLPQIKARG